jgi:hypothetical protein
MSTTTSIQIAKQDPAIEAYRLGLLGDVQQFTRDRIAAGTQMPDYQVAGLSPNEQRAIAGAQAGVGAYRPFIQQGSSAIGAGIGSLTGAASEFNPMTRVGGYFNPFENVAVQQALSDIGRQGQIQQNQAAARAVGAGAFGGSREGIERAEIGRNILEQQGRTAAQMRAAGYQQAQQAAMQGFENARQRQLQGSQLMGQLGVQQAGLGEILQNLQGSDLQNLMATGGLDRGVRQAGLDALRLTNLQRYTQPYQQYGFLSDIYSGTPTGSSTLTAASAPQVSPFQTAIGLGIQGLSAAAGANRAGLF